MSNSNNSQQSNESDLSSTTTEYEKFGYKVDGIEGINQRFLCIYCFLVMCDPIQLTECGHRCCRSCFDLRAEQSTDGNVTCPCDDCHEITNKNQIMPDKAFKKELDNLSIICVYRKDKNCPWTGYIKDYQTHLDANHIHHICSACNLNFSSKSALDEHRKTCPAIYQTCQFGELCTVDMIPKEQFRNHLLSEKHQETINKFLSGEYNLPESSTTTTNDEENQLYHQHEQELSLKLDHLSKDLQKLSADSINLNTSFKALQQQYNTAVQDLNNMHRLMYERISIKQSLQPNQEQIQKALQELDDLCNNVQYVSTDGTITWRVDQVSEKMADAQAERHTSIYSPIFYSSPTGYKMRARLFLFGDGNARRTHMSLFFLLMKGEYDSILKWPFHYKITFCLLDQTDANRHITDSFYPDVKSNSFQRPKEDANTASGIPKFVALTTLLQDDSAYVRENTLYIKIIVALDETAPKTMLPFMLTLNPALPNYVQDNLINQEAAKQQQQLANIATTSS